MCNIKVSKLNIVQKNLEIGYFSLYSKFIGIFADISVKPITIYSIKTLNIDNVQKNFTRAYS